MQRLLCLATLIVLGAAYSSSARTEELPPIRQVVSFGDSLSDAGTYWLRFTTNPGLTFAQHLALHYGQMPLPRYNWDYKTEPMPEMNNRVGNWFRGKVLGGSSSINGMVYQRGNAMDYDSWAEDPALASWSYRNVLPYFRRSESYDQGADDYRGGDGPLKVSKGIGSSPLYQVFIEAGLQAGYPYTPDMNGFQQEGFGRIDLTIANGRRQSTARAYLHPFMSRKNLIVRTGALATTRLRQRGIKNGCHAPSRISRML